MKPRLLDLFCGAGGATRGYQLAGFHVTGVDISPQPHYLGNDFIQADAMIYPLHGFDVIHASPPCQRYMTGGLVARDNHPDLLGPVRERLQKWGGTWMIENVPGAPMRPDIMMCGSMFGLQVRRHRWFELSNQAQLIMMSPCDHTKPITGVYGNPHGQAGAWPGMLPSDLETWRLAMGIDWMTASEISEAIPPAYTQYIGEQLMSVLTDRITL